jgi:hypothetical protein
MSVQRDNFDPLDDLLTSAQWPSENEGSVQRLRSAYVRASHQRGWIWRPIAAAALIVIGSAVAWTTLHSRRGEVVQVTPPVAMRAGPSVIAAASVDPLAGRPPTQLELAMVRVQEKRGVIAPVPSRESLAAKETRFAAAVAAAGIDVSLSAVREFCGVATARQLPLVLRLSRDPRVRSATVEAVGRLADAQTIAQLARQDVSSNDRRKLCAALIARGSNDAVTRYLELVADPRQQQDALASSN